MITHARKFIVATAVLSVCLLPMAVAAQSRTTAPSTSKTEVLEPQVPRDNFREEMKRFGTDIDGLSKAIEEVTTRLHGMSNATVESRKAEIAVLRERLVQLGTKLQDDAPLAGAIERYDSWIVAQLGRLNTLRQTLGPEFVEGLLKRYRDNQTEVSTARQMLNQQAQAVNTTLRELMIAELRAAEALLAHDADVAVGELREMLKAISKSIDAIRARLRSFGSAGV